MANPILAPCYRCGGKTDIVPSHGGRNSGDLTAYLVLCKCGMKEDELSNDGTKRAGIREYNRIAKQHAALERTAKP